MSKKPTIIIVEDEQFIAKDMEEILKGFGYEVPGIYDKGEDFLEELKENKMDVSIVLTDIYLRGHIDGITLAKKLFEKRIPSVFVTAYTDEKTLRKALSFPVFGFLQKPFDPLSLKLAIEVGLNNFSLFLEVEKTIESLKKNYETAQKEIKEIEEKFLEEKRIREGLVSEKEKLTKEIVSFQYYADVLKNEIERILLEKERLQEAKSEIFENLSIYIRGMRFLNNLFCEITTKNADLPLLIEVILDEFKKIFDDNCKGISIYIDGKNINSSDFINTDISYRQNFDEIQLNILFNSKESLKKHITDSSKNLIDTLLKLISCFYNNRKNLLKEKEEKENMIDLFNSINLPIIYYAENRTMINEETKKLLNISNENELKGKIITENIDLEKITKELLIEKKEKFFEYSCKIKGKNDILKVRRSLLKNNAKEFIDLILLT